MKHSKELCKLLLLSTVIMISWILSIKCLACEMNVAAIDSVNNKSEQQSKSDSTFSKSKKNIKKEINRVLLWYQFSTHRLDEFNKFLDSYDMPSIKQSHGFGLEIKIDNLSIKTPDKWFGKDFVINLKFIPTISADAIYASSGKYDPHKMDMELNIYGH